MLIDFSHVFRTLSFLWLTQVEICKQPTFTIEPSVQDFALFKLKKNMITKPF